jgi:hypothetical protein
MTTALKAVITLANSLDIMTKISVARATFFLFLIPLSALILWRCLKNLESYMSPPVSVQAPIVINVQGYGANGSDSSDDTLAVQSALNAAATASSNQGNKSVKVFFPSGRYIISTKQGLVVPSNISLLGSTTGESIIVNSPPPGAEPFVFTTRNWSDTWSYLSIARADDTSAHPPVPNNSYKELNYVYLKDRNDIQVLRSLGVPKVVSSSFTGLKSAVASGATLGNNWGTVVPEGSDPKLTLQQDNGVNPTPANFNTILAVNDAGKATLKYKNRFNWGVDAHPPNEELETYYNPSQSHSDSNIVTGPAWLLPANNYHHDISFENLIFEADTTKSNQLYGTYGLYIGYAYNVSVKNCKFRNLPGHYPILAIRAYNVLIENSQFTVQGYQGVTLDAGSGFKLYNNKFTASAWPVANLPKLPVKAITFIDLDELPIDIDIVGNQFSNLKYTSTESRSGLAISRNGGAYLKLVDNSFTNIKRGIFQASSFNSNAIVDSNIMHNSPALLFSGTGAGMVNLYNNRYVGSTKVSNEGAGFDSYNYSSNPTNYVCDNYGVTVNQWFYPTTYLAANYNQDGTLINRTNLMNVNGSPGVNGSVQTRGELNPVKISSINLSTANIKVNGQASITVSLSAPTATNFPFYLLVTAGDPDTIKLESFLLHVPAGKQQVSLSNEVLGLKPGQATISAKPLCSTSTKSASVNLSVR